MSLDVGPLVEELNSVRQTAAPSAATMTFVVYFEDATIADWVRERTHVVAAKHPSRVLLLDGSKDSRSHHIEAQEPRGEWIEIGVRHASGHDVAAALSELALAEAPIVLAWISSRLTRDDRFPIIAQRAQTVICNSSVTDLTVASQRDLIEFTEEHPAMHVQDLAYLRIAGWQDLIAEFFDRRETMDDLFGLRHVEIAAGSDAEAYYLLGWLASRLEWRACRENEMCNRKDETISFKIVREGSPRRLQRIVLQSQATAFKAEIFEDDPNAVCLEASGAHPRERRCAPIFGLDIASLVERAILQRQVDPVFRATMEMVKEIVDRNDD